MIIKPNRKAVAPAGGGSSSFAAAPPNSGYRTDGPYSVGMKFSISAGVTVTKLGRFYAPGNTGNHVVNLWSDGGSLIVGATVLAASASDAFGIKWATIASTVLAAGSYRIAVDENGENWKDAWTPTLTAPFSALWSGYGIGSGVFPASYNSDFTTYTGPAMFFT